MYKVLQVILIVSLLSACVAHPPTGTPTVTSGANSETSGVEYQDTQLCFAIKTPDDWNVDGVAGGFATFKSPTAEATFNIANVAMEEMTLEKALAEVQRGPLGPHITEVQNFTVGGQPALWVNFAPDAEFHFVVLVIAPDCGDGRHSLFISAKVKDRKNFETFLNQIVFHS